MYGINAFCVNLDKVCVQVKSGERMQKRCPVFIYNRANGETLNAIAHGNTVPSLLAQEGVTTNCSPEISTGQSSRGWSLTLNFTEYYQEYEKQRSQFKKSCFFATF